MNPNKALWEKGDFTRIAASMRESGSALAASFGIGRLYAGMPKGRARANEYFKKAENLFAGAGLEEEKTAAEKAAAATRSSQF